MKDSNNYLYTKDSENLQIPYAEYQTLMEEVQEAQRIEKIGSAVFSDLKSFLAGISGSAPATASNAPKKEEPQKKEAPEVVSAQEPVPAKAPPVKEEPKAVSAQEPAPEKEPIESSAKEAPEPIESSAPAGGRSGAAELPPFKKEISEHFNKFDESGRLFNVFTQYYSCLNDACGGTVRVTIKDGFCSLWNYDEWEEFAFVDIFEAHLRITLDPRYTDELKSLSLCEVPRLISSRRNVISVQVGDLNQVALDVLSKAFSEVGIPSK